MVSFATSIEWLYIGRVLVGISCSGIGIPSTVYTCEVSQPHVRGVLTSFLTVALSLGR